MKIISHRGNIRGSVPDKENRPSYIDCALGNGYDVEIDVRFIDNELWLGHDEPQYKVTHTWLNKRAHKLWIHCKNFDAAKECSAYQSFCHSNDPFIYTTNHKIWLHGENENIYNLDDNIIIPLIDSGSIKSFTTKFGIPFGVCTDYPILFGEK